MQHLKNRHRENEHGIMIGRTQGNSAVILQADRKIGGHMTRESCKKNTCFPVSRRTDKDLVQHLGNPAEVVGVSPAGHQVDEARRAELMRSFGNRVIIEIPGEDHSGVRVDTASVDLPGYGVADENGNVQPAGTYEPNVTDGYWLMIAPLPPGQHEIRTYVKAPGTIFGLIEFEVVTHLTVVPES